MALSLTSVLGPGSRLDHSWSYVYDSLDRPTAAYTGTPDPATGQVGFVGSPTAASGDPLFGQKWSLDELGNWNNVVGGGWAGQGLLESTYTPGSNGQTVAARTRTLHGPNARSELVKVQVDTLLPADEADTAITPYAYDHAGRMVSDGACFYRYDFFGRLCEVRRIGSLSFSSDGDPVGGDLSQAGRLVAAYSYDALGRLIRVQHPEDESIASLSVTDLYYDGARVAQEVPL